jgi:glucose-6-phosphate 1-dehydrogenase
MTPANGNPLLDNLRIEPTPGPSALVIFGASGDLTKRKIFPALYALAFRRMLPAHFAVVGAARSDWSDEEFRLAAARGVSYAETLTGFKWIARAALERLQLAHDEAVVRISQGAPSLEKRKVP